MQQQLFGYDKAAILLGALGDDLSSEVLKFMAPDEVRRLGLYISSLPQTTKEDVDEVVAEYGVMTDVSGGVDKEKIRSLLVKALTDLETKKKADKGGPAPTAELEALKWMDPQATFNMVKGEHPQAIALILSYLNPSQSAQILSQFSDDLRNDVVMRIAAMKETSTDVVQDISEALKTEFVKSATTPSPTLKSGGPKVVASLFSQMEKSPAESTLNAIKGANPALAGEIRELMFTFDDIAKLEGRSIQEMMKDVDKNQLAVAFRNASDEIKDKIYKNMSERAAEMLKEDIEARGPMKRKDVEKAQKEVAGVAVRLIEAGKIVVPKTKKEGDVAQPEAINAGEEMV